MGDKVNFFETAEDACAFASNKFKLPNASFKLLLAHGMICNPKIEIEQFLYTSKEAKKMTFEIFSFWKDNKKSGFFRLTKEELIEQFKEWLPSKDVSWHEYYSTMDALNCFISEKLSAIGNTDNDFAEYEQMIQILKPVRRIYIDAIFKKINSK
jgi:hypothetical protein